MGNIRDYAGINELICLSNMENLNAVFISEKMPQNERLIKLNQIAILKMIILQDGESRLIDVEKIFKQWNVTGKDFEYPLLDEKEF